MVLKSHRESAPGYASVPSTLCRFSIVSTLPLSAAFHESGRRPDPTSGCWREQGGGITTRRQPITSVRRAPHSRAAGRRAWRDNVFVERLWRRVKYEEVYLRVYDTVTPAHRSADTSTFTMASVLTRALTAAPRIKDCPPGPMSALGGSGRAAPKEK